MKQYCNGKNIDLKTAANCIEKFASEGGIMGEYEELLKEFPVRYIYILNIGTCREFDQTSYS